MNYIYPAVFLTNNLAMTVLMIGFGLAGESEMAADIGIVQGATLALFFAFSANARNLILNHVAPVPAREMMAARLILLFPLAAITFYLSTSLSGISPYLSAVLILRRCVEWLGEVHLSEMERIANLKFARIYIVLQTCLLVFSWAWSFYEMPLPLLGFFLWAFVPVLPSMRFIWASMAGSHALLGGIWQKILPHLGSTAIIGIAVYVFRLLLVLTIGKPSAGELFTAFAIGGVIGSLFANVLGPSIVLHEKKIGVKQMPAMLRAAILGSVLGGFALTAIFIFDLNVLDWVGRSALFWSSVGFSMLGGVVMVYAQLIRHRLLQDHQDEDLFGPDVITNIMLIAAIPFLYYLLGTGSLSILYLLGSILTLVFYWSYQKAEKVDKSRSRISKERIRFWLSVLLLIPVFFQLGHGVFRSQELDFNSHGVLSSLPIPLSLVVGHAGIMMLGIYREAAISLSFLFFSFLLMVVTTIFVAEGDLEEQAKFILLIQYILPMFGLVLGQVFASGNKGYSEMLARAFLMTLVLIVPYQLACTWLQGSLSLTPYLYIFSIYQHDDYVPVIFVAAFLIAFYELWPTNQFRTLLLAMSPIMGIYAMASESALSIVMLIAGLVGFALYRWKTSAEKLWVLLAGMALVFLCGYLYSHYGQSGYRPDSLVEKTGYWKFYADNIISSIESFLMGHNEPPDRNFYPSAHNYYLDMLYNFGAIAALPLLTLLGYTLKQLYELRQPTMASIGLLGLAAAVLILVVVENSMSVSLRQPYSGIITFYLWGILLSRLNNVKEESAHVC
jgi:hypothetical protein